MGPSEAPDPELGADSGADPSEPSFGGELLPSLCLWVPAVCWTRDLGGKPNPSLGGASMPEEQSY